MGCVDVVVMLGSKNVGMVSVSDSILVVMFVNSDYLWFVNCGCVCRYCVLYIVYIV